MAALTMPVKTNIEAVKAAATPCMPAAIIAAAATAAAMLAAVPPMQYARYGMRSASAASSVGGSRRHCPPVPAMEKRPARSLPPSR